MICLECDIPDSPDPEDKRTSCEHENQLLLNESQSKAKVRFHTYVHIAYLNPKISDRMVLLNCLSVSRRHCPSKACSIDIDQTTY